MRTKLPIYFLIALAAVIFAGCRSMNPSLMLRTGSKYKYAEFPPSQPVEYKIAPNDALSFQIFSNDAARAIDVTTITEVSAGGVPNNTRAQGNIHYKVEFDGTVKMPLLGHVKLEGLTVRQAEAFLEEKFAAYYNKPFVLLEVTNRKVTIFPGNEGTARVVPLQNENTTLLEALAAAGGIANSGKAYKIKLIRGDLKNPQVYLIDLSTIQGMEKADLILQSDDLIYVEPRIRLGNEIISSILPYLTFITTTILFVEFIRKTP